jgi:hypothetical protein
MTVTNQLPVLPMWVWLIFTILIIGVVTLIYSRGNWRTTLGFTALAVIVILFAAGFDAWREFLRIHFVGEYDKLGIPFRRAGPGWSILLEAWPLWVVPTLFAAVLALVIDWVARHFHKPHSEKIPESDNEASLSAPTAALQNVNYQLEADTLKQELALTQEKFDKVVASIEQQVDKNLELEVQLAELEEASQNEILALRDKIKSLESEIAQNRNKT